MIKIPIFEHRVSASFIEWVVKIIDALPVEVAAKNITWQKLPDASRRMGAAERCKEHPRHKVLNWDATEANMEGFYEF